MEVYKAIAAVMAEIGKTGISKDRTAQGYKFRGVDDVLNTLNPILSSHNLVILPRVISRESVERVTKNGAVLFYVTLLIEFDFVSAVDATKHTIATYGEAMDSSDKATNKAMSAAYKYACFQAFCIPTEGDNDTENSNHEVAAIEYANATEIASIKQALLFRGIEEARALLQWKVESFEVIPKNWVVGILQDLKPKQKTGAIVNETV
jgi:hypothetical protein